ncbi:hypothetical protein HJC23_000126 [Cyclotella cryptica]|uniref:Fatty acid desaturase domain-containing protein n=1 Tax=Cyclotella cryptica TaxID=29204 RepID=A0ABD3NYT8_9STRA|eukprot:CCRYP_018928-RA/>CCRYP_018928-RA protein AED:0.19 eAED:0.19 QI:0/-1/0/1/-1/1/1/0/512
MELKTLLQLTIFVQFLTSCRCYSPAISHYIRRVSPLLRLQPRFPSQHRLSRRKFDECRTLNRNGLRSSLSIHDDINTQSSSCDENTDIVQPSQSNGEPTAKNTSEAAPDKTIVTEPPTSSTSLSPAAQWHQRRHQEMLQKYRSQILPLERDSSNFLALSLLALSNISLLALSLLSGNLSIPKVILFAIFPGSMFSLWTLQILHDCLHGSLFPKQNTFTLPLIGRVKRKSLQNALLFWGSMPSAFGYYLYLKYGHLSHHKSLGDAEKVSLKTLFDSDRKEFEDGDMLFVAHRMKLKGEVGPRFQLGRGEKKKMMVMSISKGGFSLWKEGCPVRNALVFASSFLYERVMLMVNDVIVALTGRNYFFPNKPKQFHDECAVYCRFVVAVRALLWKISGWKALLFLYLSETLWSIPPHPACAMFVTNHGSTIDETTGECVPSSSTYAGRWYSIFTLGTNYHVEHHDFPTIPLHRLGKLREIAPEYYRAGTKDNLWSIMKKAFSRPEFYACMDAGVMV